MTNIKILKKNNEIVLIQANGHACFSDYGQDIVCASISTLLGNCHLGLVKVAKVKVKHNQKQGEFKLEILEHNTQANAILQTTLLSLSEIAMYYSKNLKLELIGE